MNDPYVEQIKKRFKKEVSDDFDFSKDGITARLHRVIEDLGKELMPHAATRAGMQPEALENRISNITMIDIDEVNGFTRSSDNWKTFEICINVGLMFFFHAMIKVFATRIGAMGYEGVPQEDPEISFEDTISTAKRLMKAYWDKDFMTATMGFRLTQLTENQFNIAAALLHHAECFVVAHELGHIVIRIHHGEVAELSLGIEAAKGILMDIPDLTQASKNQLTKKWGEEIGADIIGLQLSLNVRESADERIQIYSATELVFILQNMLETFYEKTIGEKLPLGSHPPSQMRLNILRSLARAKYSPQVFQLGDSFEKMAGIILSYM